MAVNLQSFARVAVQAFLVSRLASAATGCSSHSSACPLGEHALDATSLVQKQTTIKLATEHRHLPLSQSSRQTGSRDEASHLDILAAEGKALYLQPSWTELSAMWAQMNGKHVADVVEDYKMYLKKIEDKTYQLPSADFGPGRHGPATQGKKTVDLQPSVHHFGMAAAGKDVGPFLEDKTGDPYKRRPMQVARIKGSVPAEAMKNRLDESLFDPWVEEQSRAELVILEVPQKSFAALWLPTGTGLLFTIGMAPCIGIAIRAEVGHEGSGSFAIALAHADSDTDTSTAIASMLQELKTLVNGGAGALVSLINPVVTLMAGRDPSGGGRVRDQFQQLLASFRTLEPEAEADEMCTLLGRAPTPFSDTDGLISTKPLPKLTGSTSLGSPVTCSGEIAKADKVRELLDGREGADALQYAQERALELSGGAIMKALPLAVMEEENH